MNNYEPFSFPVRDGDIEKLENKLAASLPQDYVNFLKSQGNGGLFLTPHGSLYSCFMCSRENDIQPSPIVIERIFSVGVDPHESPYDVEGVYDALFSVEPDYPPEYLPIAGTDAGDTVAMRVTEPEKGRIVVFWYDRHCSEASFVARSFTEFIEGITEVRF
jgi:cell wall assembly regulator SMI1